MMEKILIGWQKQPNKLNIQGTIEKAIEEITKEKIELNASGRTDAARNTRIINYISIRFFLAIISTMKSFINFFYFFYTN